jgi:hypothetical protein
MPFMGIRASGQFGKSLVAFSWKGINAIRSYVIPTNPNTLSQQAVRGDFTAQIDAWHHADMLADDKDAWNLFASATKRAASGFNEFVGYFRRWWTDTGVVSHIRSVVVTVNTGGTLTITAKTDNPGTNKAWLYYGPTKTYMPNSKEGSAWSSGNGTFSLTGMVAGTKLYFCIIDETITEEGPPVIKSPYGRTGIYKVTIAT